MVKKRWKILFSVVRVLTRNSVWKCGFTYRGGPYGNAWTFCFALFSPRIMHFNSVRHCTSSLFEEFLLNVLDPVSGLFSAFGTLLDSFSNCLNDIFTVTLQVTLHRLVLPCWFITRLVYVKFLFRYSIENVFNSHLSHVIELCATTVS